MDYNTDKILQRQRICRKCRSFVTFEKSDEGKLICPLCSHHLEKTVNRLKSIGIDDAKIMIQKQIAEKYGLEYKPVKKEQAVEKEADTSNEETDPTIDETENHQETPEGVNEEAS